MTHSHLFNDLAQRLDGARRLLAQQASQGDAATVESMVDAIDCARAVMLQLASLSLEDAVTVVPDSVAMK